MQVVGAPVDADSEALRGVRADALVHVVDGTVRMGAVAVLCTVPLVRSEPEERLRRARLTCAVMHVHPVLDAGTAATDAEVLLAPPVGYIESLQVPVVRAVSNTELFVLVLDQVVGAGTPTLAAVVVYWRGAGADADALAAVHAFSVDDNVGRAGAVHADDVIAEAGLREIVAGGAHAHVSLQRVLSVLTRLHADAIVPEGLRLRARRGALVGPVHRQRERVRARAHADVPAVAVDVEVQRAGVDALVAALRVVVEREAGVRALVRAVPRTRADEVEAVGGAVHAYFMIIVESVHVARRNAQRNAIIAYCMDEIAVPVQQVHLGALMHEICDTFEYNLRVPVWLLAETYPLIVRADDAVNVIIAHAILPSVLAAGQSTEADARSLRVAVELHFGTDLAGIASDVNSVIRR